MWRRRSYYSKTRSFVLVRNCSRKSARLAKIWLREVVGMLRSGLIENELFTSGKEQSE